MLDEIKMPFEPKMSIDEVINFLNLSRQDVHLKLKNYGITCPKLGQHSYINYDIARKLFAIPFKKTKIAVEMPKGGTGKTTTVDNLSSCINTYGARVLMIDVDSQGSLTKAKDIDSKNLPILTDILHEAVSAEETIVHLSPGLDLIPSNPRNIVIDNKIINDRMPLDRLFNRLLSSVVDNYDVIIIDLPPFVGHIVAAASLFADLVIAPINPDEFSVVCIEFLQDEMKKLNKLFDTVINYKFFLNEYSSNTVSSNEVYELLMNDVISDKMFKSTIRDSQEIVNLTRKKHNLFTSLKKLPARRDFDQLTREVFAINQQALIV